MSSPKLNPCPIRNLKSHFVKKLSPKPQASVTLDSTNLRKNFLWNTIGSTVSAFSSLFYLMIVTRLNTIDDAGIFSFAFSTAAFLMVVGTYSGRTFQVTDKNAKTTDSDYLYFKLTTCLAMILVGLVFCLARGYSGDKLLIIMFLIVFRALEALSEFTYAVIQKKDRLYQVGRSLLLKSLASLAGFFLIDFLTRSIAFSCIMILLANFTLMLIYDLPRLLKSDFRLAKIRPEKIFYLLKIGFFTFGFNFLGLYLVNAARYALDSTASDSVQAIYGIILMPATILGLIGQYIIQPFLTSFKKFFATDPQQFQNLTLKLCLVIIAAGTLCVIAACLAGIPVLELLYALDLSGTLPGLILILIGGTFGTLVFILATALITMRRTADQFIAYCLAAIVAFVLSQNLVAAHGLTGACLSYMLSMLLLFVMYVVIFAYRLHRLKLNPVQEIQHASQE